LSDLARKILDGELFCAEYPVDELADDALQTTAAAFLDRLARGVQTVRGANHRLRERGSGVLHRSPHQGHFVVSSKSHHSDQQGTLPCSIGIKAIRLAVKAHSLNLTFPSPNLTNK